MVIVGPEVRMCCKPSSHLFSMLFMYFLTLIYSTLLTELFYFPFLSKSSLFAFLKTKTTPGVKVIDFINLYNLFRPQRVTDCYGNTQESYAVTESESWFNSVLKVCIRRGPNCLNACLSHSASKHRAISSTEHQIK